MYIRGSFISRTLDFSARAVITSNTSLNISEINIPKKIFIKLWFLEYLRYLKVKYNESFEKIRIIVKNSDHLINYNLQYMDEFIQYFLYSDEVDERLKLIVSNRQPTL
jgi:DNA-directed RNA polymerase beta' subunit